MSDVNTMLRGFTPEEERRIVKAPEMPATISPDGRELWDWAGKMSEHIHRLDRIRVLKADIHRIKRECGSCEYWMTRSCPKEKHDNQRGVSRGPSMGALICDKFIMKSSSSETMNRWETELKELEATP